MQIAPEEIAFIGDSSVGYDTALAAGMHPIVVSWGFRTYEELVRSIPADFIVEEFEELYARLRELTGK
jgi:phosphoglycolate phosphatase-like HAD superfamily hydrolase